MTLRELLQNKDINLDDKLYIQIPTYDKEGYDYVRAFAIDIIEIATNEVLLSSKFLNEEIDKKQLII